jgi:HlyD family secretion protein
MNRRGRGYLILTVILLAIFLTGAYFLYPTIGKQGTNQKFRTMKVERGEIGSIVTATGTINPVITVLVGSQVSGTIKALYADFNSRVKEGQVITQIDPAIFEAQVEQGRANVLSAQANLLSAQANLKNGQANLSKAEIAVVDAKRTLERNHDLIERKVIAQATLDTAQTSYATAIAQKDMAKAQLESARSQVESSKAQVEQARAGLKVAETNLRYTTIRSPVNGIVISRNVDVGQTVAASLQAPTLFTIAKDLTQMQVETNVSEADIGRIVKNQEATFTVDAYPEKTFRGRVSEIRNAPTIIQNVVTYNVVIQVSNPELKLKPGMTANVSVLIDHKEGVLKIPNSALRFRPESAKKEEAGEKGKTGALGTTGTPGAAGSGPPSQGRAIMERLVKELNLTQDQQTKIGMVLQSSRPEFQEIREKAKPEEARTRIQTLLRQKIWGFLTEEQKRKFNELQSTRGEQARPGRVWTLSPEKKPVSISVMLGVTDGTFSEVVGGEVREGLEVIVEETGNKKSQAKGPSPPSFTRGLGK